MSVILSQFIDVTLFHFLTSYITLSCDANVTLKILRERVRVGEKREREREREREKREERREKRERELKIHGVMLLLVLDSYITPVYGANVTLEIVTLWSYLSVT